MPDTHTFTMPIVLPSDQDISGRTLGEEEVALVSEAIRSGTLTSTTRPLVHELEQRFAELTGKKQAYACSSGTAAIHCAIAALNTEPGDEVITTAITDMGAISPILIRERSLSLPMSIAATGNITVKSVSDRISERTAPLIVTLLFGNPSADRGRLLRWHAAAASLSSKTAPKPFWPKYDGRPVGSFADIACFSLQQGKHVTTGEGGLVVTTESHLARRLYLFINKAWGYGDPNPDHYFLALNYRMSELQGAVAVAQLEKLTEGVKWRRTMAARLDDALPSLTGISRAAVLPGALHSYWRYALLVDGDKVPGGPVALGKGLKDWSIASSPRYIQKPAFECQVIRNQCTFGTSRYPFTLARAEAIDYHPARFPGTFRFLEQVLVLPWNERYQERHVDYLANALDAQHKVLTEGLRHG